jgi:DNA polymerase III epsilon subunit-like protein
MSRRELWISVDTEASGPTPSTGSLISIGACLVNEPAVAFYAELKPVPGMPWSDEAEGVHQLSRTHLADKGREPAAAMNAFADWLEAMSAKRDGAKPVFLGFNATFDWMFVADYFHRFIGRNPFGISGPDIKAYYAGVHVQTESWGQTAKRYARAIYPNPPGVSHTHNALDDAREQADLFRQLRGNRPLGR